MSFHPNDVVRRGRNASIIVTGVILILLVAFFRTQVLDHSQWVMQSEENRLRQVPIPAPRGVIVDRKGEIIAENSVSYNVSMLVKNEGELKATMEQLSELIPMSTVSESVVTETSAVSSRSNRNVCDGAVPVRSRTVP